MTTARENALYDICFHVVRGPVLVPLVNLEILFDTTNIPKAVFRLALRLKRKLRFEVQGRRVYLEVQ